MGGGGGGGERVAKRSDIAGGAVAAPHILAAESAPIAVTTARPPACSGTATIAESGWPATKSPTLRRPCAGGHASRHRRELRRRRAHSQPATCASGGGGGGEPRWGRTGRSTPDYFAATSSEIASGRMVVKSTLVSAARVSHGQHNCRRRRAISTLRSIRAFLEEPLPPRPSGRSHARRTRTDCFDSIRGRVHVLTAHAGRVALRLRTRILTGERRNRLTYIADQIYGPITRAAQTVRVGPVGFARSRPSERPS